MATFTDDFNRANTSDLGAGWVEVSGDWSIVSNQLSPGSSGGTIILRASGAMDSSDHSAQVKIAATTAASQGVWCRGNSNISSGYLWRNDGSSWDLFSVVGGSFTVIGTYAAAAAPGDVAKVQAVGSTIKAFVNGVERVSLTNTHVTTGTSVGLRSESTNAIRFDDFTAADVTAGATLDVAASTETAQTLAGAKAATLGIAAASHAAQALTGSKSGVLSVSANLETAQALSGLKAAALDPAGGAEAAQPLTGGKTSVLGIALAGAAAQALVGAKTASLTTAATIETAEPLTLAASLNLATAAATEAARPLTGAKTATLAPAIEGSTARPLAAAGPDEDVDLTVGAPYSPWQAGTPHGSGWEVGTPW
ncbi:hypothetical protein ACFYVK_35365 [Streptomyces chartreusis]|uniref:hypothetical protein n=1 Tax=Streptomyces chartreusis TaxID=1969 RepID=UPI0036B46C6B